MALPSTNRSHSDLAAKEADRLRTEASERLKLANEYALGGLKGLFLANGGAIVALLTFVGNEKARNVNADGLWCGFIWFSLGLAAILAAYVAGYVSHANYMQAEFKLSAQEDSNAFQTGNNYDHSADETRGNFAENVGIGLVIISLGMFVLGAFASLDAIT